MKQRLTKYFTRAGEHHVAKAKHHAAMAEHLSNLADDLGKAQNDGALGLSEMCKAMAAEHAGVSDEHTGMADECAKCAKAFSEANKSMHGDELDEVMPTRISVVAPTAPANGVRPVYRTGQPVRAASEEGSELLDKIFSVAEDE